MSMPYQVMEQGIQAIQAGNIAEGSRLLRIALRENNLTGNIRAIGYLWLAETKRDRNFKVDCYNRALEADPENQDVLNRLSALFSSQLPSPPTGEYPQVNDSQQMPPANPPAQQYPAQQPAAPQKPPTIPGGEPPILPTDSNPYLYPQNPYNPPPVRSDSQPLNPMQRQLRTPESQEQYLSSQGFYRTVGILGGPNGPGSGFFVTPEGLVATTRYVVGGVQNVVIELFANKRTAGRVVRAYPELDLAFIMTEVKVRQLLTITNRSNIQDLTPLTAVVYGKTSLSGIRRPTQQQLPPHWFPTDIDRMADAGGNPIFDESNYLLGMLTKNAGRSSKHYYGLHINKVFECVEHYIQETRVTRHRMYCPGCGHVSRAAEFQAFYCEQCGSVLPYALDVPRFQQPHTDALYKENMNSPCPSCGARVGTYNNLCLRCGRRTTRF